MKTAIPVVALVLTACMTNVFGDTIVRWRLDEGAPPIVAAEGAPNLKWWVEKDGLYASSNDVPPADLYRGQADRPLNSFDAGQSYSSGAVSGLITTAQGDFWNVQGGLTVEGFFKTKKSKPDHERQAVISCGEGFADIAWIVRLIDGRPSFGVFQGNSPDPVAAVEVDQDVREDRWYYFVARVVPGSPGKLTLTVKGEGNAALSAETDLPAGFSIRQNRKPIIIGRSSLFIDNKPGYRGTWDTFAGLISDLRISHGSLADDQLLGEITK